jgi:fatty acid desaturase
MTGKSPYPIPVRRNVAIIVAQLAAVAACFWLARAAGAWWQLGLLALGFGVLMNSVYAIIHEAEHGILLPDRRANDAVGVVLAALFPAPFHLIRQGHIGHHLRNRSDDEAFDFYFDGEHPVWKCLQLYGILTGFYYLVVVLSNVIVVLFPFVLDKRHFTFDKPSAAFMESLNPKYRRWIQMEGLLAVALHVGIVWGLGIPVVNYLVMYAGFGFTWSAMQYVHHYGTERDVVKGARNLFVWGPLDRLWLNHNWHQTHHAHPTVPWTHLPDLGRAENPRRGFLLWAYLRMWRGPRRTDQHVENRYAGRVIQ